LTDISGDKIKTARKLPNEKENSLNRKKILRFLWRSENENMI